MTLQDTYEQSIAASAELDAVFTGGRDSCAHGVQVPCARPRWRCRLEQSPGPEWRQGAGRSKLVPIFVPLAVFWWGNEGEREGEKPVNTGFRHTEGRSFTQKTSMEYGLKPVDCPVNKGARVN